MIEFLVNLLIMASIFLAMTCGSEIFASWYKKTCKVNRMKVRRDKTCS